MLAVGATTRMTAVVAAHPGVQYELRWSLPAGTSAATIDTATGVLTAVAPGFVSPAACATAVLTNGQRQTMCSETTMATVRIVRPATSAGSALAFVQAGTVFEAASNGSEPVPLLAEAARPAWSPDGRRIAFTRPVRHLLTRWQLCVARADGTDVRCAIGEADGQVVGGPSWSPDGSMVAFSLWIHDCPNGQCGQLGGYFTGLSLLDTRTMKFVTLGTPPVSAAAWSPDGRRIAVALFGVGTFGRGALGIVNSDGSGLQTLAMSLGSYSVKEVAWSPDAGRLALALDDENACPWYCDTAIGVINADGSDLRVLDRASTSNEVYLWTPAWSLDGTRLAYTVSRGDECAYDDVPCGSSIAVVGAEGGPIELLVSAGGFPSWRP